MAAALGETSDPKELIPGDAEKLGELATALTNWSDRFDGIGDGLHGLRIPGWTGQASDTFWPTLSKEKTNWYLAADAMSGAAATVTSYSSTLSWAQQQAATAITQWESGQHDSAEEVLRSARQQLEHEAEILAKKLDDLAGGASDSPDWLSKAREEADAAAESWASKHGVGKTAVSPTAWAWEKTKWREGENSRWSRTQKEWGKDADGNWYVRDKPASEDGTGSTPGNKAEVKIKLAEWTDSGSVWSDGDDWKGSAGGINFKGAAGVSTLGYDGSVGASIAQGQLQAGASGSAYLAQASISGSAEYGVAAVQGEGKAFVGADGSAKASVGKDGVHLGAEAFAGAKATGSVSADVAGVGAGVGGEAWAGAGASASADVGMQDGKFTIGGEAGIGLGVGGKVSVDITIDPNKMVDSVDDVADAVGDTWDSTVGSWF